MVKLIRVACFYGGLSDEMPSFIANKLLKLSERGVDVTLVCSKKGLISGRVKKLGDKVRVLYLPKIRPLSFVILFPFYFTRSLLERPREILVLGGRMWVTRESLKDFFAEFFRIIPLLWMDFDVIHFEFGHSAYVYKKLFLVKDIIKPKLVVSFRGADLEILPLRSGIEAYSVVFDKADFIHFVSRTLLERAREFGYSKDNYLINPSSVDVGFFSRNGVRKKTDGPIRLITLAALRWKKGHEYALSAVKKLVDEGYNLTYSIIGDGPYKEAVQYAIHQLGLNDVVELKGKLQQSEVKAELGRADVYLQASVEEGFGNSPLEAMAMELPVVITDAGGIKEYILNGENGFVVEKRNPRDMAEKIKLLIDDPQLRISVGRKARRTVVENFTLDVQAKKFIEVYYSLITSL